MSTFEARFAIHHHIVPFLSGPTLVALIATHRDFRANLASFVASFREMINIKEPKDQLQFAAQIGSRELCEVMRPWGSLPELSFHPILPHQLYVFPNFPLNWNWMLRGIVQCHDTVQARKLCALACSWGANDRRSLLSLAALYGNRDLCEFARDWHPVIPSAELTPEGHAGIGAMDPGIAITFLNSMGAFRCQFDYANMLSYAARGGHRDICELARSWARSDPGPGADLIPDEALYQAIGGIPQMEESVFWFRPSDARLLEFDRQTNRRELCELLYSWVISDIGPGALDEGNPITYTILLTTAAFYGRRDLCELVRSWGLARAQPMDWNKMYQEAARGKHPELCELARSWGATL